MDLAGIVLAGGTGRRLGGADKARLRWRDRMLLEHVLDALDAVGQPVVVGEEVAGLEGRGVRFVREDPPGGGPAAGLLAGLAAVPRAATAVAVVAVDMPGVTAATVRRLRATAAGHDGAVLLGAGGRRQLAMVLDVARLRAVRPPGPADGMPVHRLLAGLDLAEVPATGEEALDVDTPDDVAALDAAGTRPVTVEPVGPDEWERWARLRLAALAGAPAAYGSRLADWADAGEERWRDRLAVRGGGFWLARHGGSDVGMVAAQPDETGGWWLVSMWVDPSARGAGVADALVEAVADHVRRAGGAEVRLHVRETNAPARAAYARLGFTPTGTVVDDPGGPELELVRALLS